MALWVNEPGPDAKLELRKDVPLPALKPNEILVKMQYSGLWYTQLISPYRTWT